MDGRTKGGQATRAKHGISHCPECGQVIPSGYYSRIGAKGATVMHQKHRGKEREWGKLGGRGNKKGGRDDG